MAVSQSDPQRQRQMKPKFASCFFLVGTLACQTIRIGSAGSSQLAPSRTQLPQFWQYNQSERVE